MFCLHIPCEMMKSSININIFKDKWCINIQKRYNKFNIYTPLGMISFLCFIKSNEFKYILKLLIENKLKGVDCKNINGGISIIYYVIHMKMTIKNVLPNNYLNDILLVFQIL